MNRVCIEKDEKGDIVGIYSDELIRFFEANERDILKWLLDDPSGIA